MEEAEEGGRIFFSNIGRSMEVEDEIELISVGIDFGSATSHLAFSRIVLERLDTRYMVVERTLLHQSDILLTPYLDDESIDAAKLGRFVVEQYRAAGITPSAVDTGALILTGVAARRANAFAIGELFAAETGKFVVVSAGDALETTLAAFGSGAVARSAAAGTDVLNIDIGGGTSKLALCRQGAVAAISAIDVGARVITIGPGRRVERVEEAGRYFAGLAGVALAPGIVLAPADEQAIVDLMADALLAAIGFAPPRPDFSSLYRLPPLPPTTRPGILTISGGVSEFFYADRPGAFDDLGPALARTLRARLDDLGARVERPAEGMRATVIGASQYTVQVSGSTIFVEPMSILPLRNVPVIKPLIPFDERIDPGAVADAVRAALARLDLDRSEQPIACYYDWEGAATFARLDAFCRGVIDGLGAAGTPAPFVLVGKGDVGGLVGIHFRHERDVERIISIDGIELDELDFIDIGRMLEASGAVPVVVKSLVFPGQGLGGAGAR